WGPEQAGEGIRPICADSHTLPFAAGVKGREPHTPLARRIRRSSPLRVDGDHLPLGVGRRKARQNDLRIYDVHAEEQGAIGKRWIGIGRVKDGAAVDRAVPFPQMDRRSRGRSIAADKDSVGCCRYSGITDSNTIDAGLRAGAYGNAVSTSCGRCIIADNRGPSIRSACAPSLITNVRTTRARGDVAAGLIPQKG